MGLQFINITSIKSTYALDGCICHTSAWFLVRRALVPFESFRMYCYFFYFKKFEKTLFCSIQNEVLIVKAKTFLCTSDVHLLF